MGAAVMFAVGARVRFKPGQGTYGYELDTEADGRVPAVVEGAFPSGRIKIRFTAGYHRKETRAVDAASLIEEPR